MGIYGSKIGCMSCNYPSPFVTCSIAKKNRYAKKYSLNAPPENPVTSLSFNMTNFDRKPELGSPDFSTVIDNKSQAIRAEDTPS